MTEQIAQMQATIDSMNQSKAEQNWLATSAQQCARQAQLQYQRTQSDRGNVADAAASLAQADSDMRGLLNADKVETLAKRIGSKHELITKMQGQLDGLVALQVAYTQSRADILSRATAAHANHHEATARFAMSSAALGSALDLHASLGSSHAELQQAGGAELLSVVVPLDSLFLHRSTLATRPLWQLYPRRVSGSV